MSLRSLEKDCENWKMLDQCEIVLLSLLFQKHTWIEEFYTLFQI